MRESTIIAHARGAARLALRGGLAVGVRVVDWDGLIDATEPPEAAEADLVADRGGEPLSRAERALWLGTWRATLREGRQR